MLCCAAQPVVGACRPPLAKNKVSGRSGNSSGMVRVPTSSLACGVCHAPAAKKSVLVVCKRAIRPLHSPKVYGSRSVRPWRCRPTSRPTCCCPQQQSACRLSLQHPDTWIPAHHTFGATTISHSHTPLQLLERAAGERRELKSPAAASLASPSPPNQALLLPVTWPCHPQIITAARAGCCPKLPNPRFSLALTQATPLAAVGSSSSHHGIPGLLQPGGLLHLPA